MTSPMSGALRWGRALLLTVVVMTTGTAGHVSADGLLPPFPVLVALLGFCTVLCAGALGPPASRLRVVVLTVLGQAGVHMVLSVMAGHVGERSALSTFLARVSAAHPVRRGGSLHDDYLSNVPAVRAGDGADAVAHLISDLAAHAPMMGAHLVAAALVGLWLASGEQALWTLLALTGGLLVGLVEFIVVVPGPPRPLGAAPARDLPAPRLAALAPCVVRRGPPVLLAA